MTIRLTYIVLFQVQGSRKFVLCDLTGRGGCKIREIEESSGARIKVIMQRH